jgi:acyl-CoA synthetase (AMP-forming)/AMP-acid ligase II
LDSKGKQTLRGPNTGGENIIPKDIEDILITHPDVWKAAVIGIKDDKWGEVVGVFLQQSSAQESRLKEKNLKVWMRKHKIAPHKMPDHYFHIGRDEGVPDELPVNGSGKVLKAVLRSVAQEVVSRRLGAL